MPTPITRLEVHAVWPGRLYIGRAPRGRDVPTLKRAGVTAVLSVLRTDDPYQAPAGLLQQAAWASIRAEAGVPSGQQLTEGVEQLRRWHRDGRVTYVHGLLGTGLAPVLAMAYVWSEAPSRRGWHGLGAAIAEVLAACPTADPSPHQLKALCDYALMRDAA